MSKIFKKYKLETDMCDELIIFAKKNNWIVYPEQGGWDLLLIRNNIQIGIQSKLRPNIKLLSQALVPLNVPGPHYRAVAVGNSTWEERELFKKITDNLKLIFIDMGVHSDFWFHNLKPLKYYRHFPKKVVYIPPFVPDLKAGIPSPVSIGPWKIVAIKLELLAEEQGWASIIDARNIVKEELPEEYYGSYPRTLLQTYFTCTKLKDPRNSRCKKWVLNKDKPSKKFKYVFNKLKGD